MWLPPVGQQDNNDDDEEQPSSSCDAEDSRKGEQAVGPDVNLSRRDVESSHLDLDDNSTRVSTVFQNSVENAQITKKIITIENGWQWIQNIFAEELNWQVQWRYGPFSPNNRLFEEKHF